MALPLDRLPRYLVLEPVSTVRFEVRPARRPCEIEVALENPAPGRCFLLLLGPEGGPLLQRMRLSGRARILFEPRDERPQVLMLANPQKEPVVLELHGRSSRPRRSSSAAHGPRSREPATQVVDMGPARRPRARLPAHASATPRGSASVGQLERPFGRPRPKG